MTRENAKNNFQVWNRLSQCLRSWLWHLIWRDRPMTPPPSPLTLLCDHLAQLSRTKAGDLALARFSEAGVDVVHAASLSDFVLPDGRGMSRLRRIAFVDQVGSLAPRDEVAALCAVVCLRPELIWMSRLLTQGSFVAEDADSEVVVLAFETFTKADGRRPRPKGYHAVVNSIWTQARRSAGLRRRGNIDAVPLPEEFDPVASEVDPAERWPGLLAAAVARGVLTPRQVVMIAQTRMEQRPLREVAAALGRPYDAVRKERRRAEAALRDFALASWESE
jgi:DNA-directed RNA polymerase specialized sigma24 family protein